MVERRVRYEYDKETKRKYGRIFWSHPDWESYRTVKSGLKIGTLIVILYFVMDSGRFLPALNFVWQRQDLAQLFVLLVFICTFSGAYCYSRLMSRWAKSIREKVDLTSSLRSSSLELSWQEKTVQFQYLLLHRNSGMTSVII